MAMHLVGRIVDTGRSIDPRYTRQRGPLESVYCALKPDASAGIDVCLFLQNHPHQLFTKADLARRCGCSVGLVGEVVRVLGTRLLVVRGRPWHYSYGCTFER